MVNWGEAIMPFWLVIAAVVAGAIGFRRYRWHILGATGLFLFPQILFPIAYAGQDYYFYACAVFLIVALGFVLLGALDSGLPYWMRWLIVAVPLVAMLASYRAYYYRGQIVWSDGGWGFTDALRMLTPADSVIVVAGADWAPMIPYYSQRKALMIRNGLQYDAPYLIRAFSDLDDENVSALVVVGDERKDGSLIQRTVKHFSLDSSPTFSGPFADIYLGYFCREFAVRALTQSNNFNQVTFNAQPAVVPLGNIPIRTLTPGIAAPMFPMVSPPPSGIRFTYGYSSYSFDGATVLSLHPDSDLWVPVPAGATQIRWEFGILPAAYERAGPVTNGVEFIIEVEAPDGTRRRIFRRLLDPAAYPKDRGRQRLVLPYRLSPGETLVFLTRPNGGYSFDWAYASLIEVK
jgi:hypothetical protein